MHLQQENITCSLGVGPNKLITESLLDIKKPDCHTVVRPQDVRDFFFRQTSQKSLL